MHGPGRVAPGARKTQMGTRRRRRRSQIAAPRPVTGDNIAVPSVEIRSRLDLMRLANAESVRRRFGDDMLSNMVIT